MERDMYKEQKVDMVKLVLRLRKIMWIPLAALVAGAGLFAFVYALQYRLTNGPLYRAVSKIYLDFASDETGEVYEYYNGYTWNDLMSTDPIIGRTMEALPGMDRSVVEQSTKAEILSDIRLLTVTVSHEDKEICGQIQEATERALESLGESAKEFRSITVVKSVKPEPAVEEKRIRQAALLGAVLCFIAAFIGLLLYLILDDTVFVPSDILGNLDVPFLGIEMKADGAEKEEGRYHQCMERFRLDLQSNKEYVCPGQEQAAVLDAYELMTAGEALPVDYEALRNAPYVILQVKFAKVSLRMLHYLLQQLSLQKCEQVGLVITEADAAWMYSYFNGRGGACR